MIDNRPFLTNKDSFFDFDISFKELSEVSDVAKLYYDKKCRIYVCNTSEDEEGFHPTGKCGCLEVDDDYRFGIRCDHLMWAEGWNEFFSVTDKNGNCIDNTLYIYGNHKGGFSSIVIAFDNSGDESVGKYVPELIRLDPYIELQRVKFHSKYDFDPVFHEYVKGERVIIKHKDGFYITAHGNGFLSAYSALKFYRYLQKHPEEMENNKAKYISETEECNKKREERKEKERKEFEERQNNRKSNDTDSSILDDILSKL